MVDTIYNVIHLAYSVLPREVLWLQIAETLFVCFKG